MSKQLFKKEKIYYNIYLRFTFLIFVTIMFLSSILCFQFENTLKYQLYSSEQLKLQQASYSAKLLTDYLISLSKQIYFDRDINLLRVIDNLNYEEKIKALKQLQHYKTMTDFVTSIYV